MKSRLLTGFVFFCVTIFAAFAVLSFIPVDRTTEAAAKTKYLSIPACAFNEIRWGTDWNTRRQGGFLATYPSGAANSDIGVYYAPVQLPHGAVIKTVRFLAKNNDTPGITMTLERGYISGGTNSTQTMATVTMASLTAAYTTVSTSSITNPTVNNVGSCYALRLYLPDVEANDVILHHAEIVYTGKW